MEATLFDFDGRTYSPVLDRARLNKQLAAVFGLMKDGVWRTPAEIATGAGCDWASASARLRDLRKSRFGGYTVLRRRRAGAERAGVFEYRVVVP